MKGTDKKFRKTVDEPTMSDATLLLKVEDFIAVAFGKLASNTVNFTMLRHILYILATQMRLLEQDVEIRFSEEDDILMKLKELYGIKDEEEGNVEVEEEEREEELDKRRLSLKGDKQAKEEKNGKTKDKKGSSDLLKPVASQDKPEPIRISIDTPATTASQGQVDAEEEKAEGSVTRIGSIEVVTPAKFQTLQNLVEELLNRMGDAPLPTMPSNEDLLAELAKGTASLTDTMEAMQVSERVETAEKVITKMAEVLTLLALSGALPPEVAETIAMIQEDMQKLALGADPESLGEALEAPSQPIEGISTASALAESEPEKVTHPELQDVLDATREELMQNLTILVAKAELNNERTHESAQEIEDNMEIAKSLNGRISKLQSMTDKEHELLDGFDVEMLAQVEAFNGHISKLRDELTDGIIQLDSINNNAEALALASLGVGYENLMVGLEQATNSHGGLVMAQKQLTDELKFLVSAVDLMKEEKADRDEVADGLKDKANVSRLRGLVKQTTFEETRHNLDNIMTDSHDKFSKQEQGWMNALKELNEVIKKKASIMDILSLRETAMQSLNENYEFLRRLEALLGDPQIAILTRKLSRNAYCGPCVTPALMDIFDKRSGAPPKLPALLRHKEVEETGPDNEVRKPDDTGKHICKRFVGGSHTLLTERGSHEHTSVTPDNAVPTKQYTGYGIDGRLYLMEEELEPCVECSKLPSVKFEGV
ncbi:unnamed protein product [Arctia plantaginis]|uniref:DUF4795 domain-containing protein n=1 Tax=Arctia plantaginis TaxID=874455 RepID=A0A8S0YVP5_ARCPL|nr:unnamed protein product [Arctia plantaginis]